MRSAVSAVPTRDRRKRWFVTLGRLQDFIVILNLWPQLSRRDVVPGLHQCTRTLLSLPSAWLQAIPRSKQIIKEIRT